MATGTSLNFDVVFCGTFNKPSYFLGICGPCYGFGSNYVVKIVGLCPFDMIKWGGRESDAVVSTVANGFEAIIERS